MVDGHRAMEIHPGQRHWYNDRRTLQASPKVIGAHHFHDAHAEDAL